MTVRRLQAFAPIGGTFSALVCIYLSSIFHPGLESLFKLESICPREAHGCEACRTTESCRWAVGSWCKSGGIFHLGVWCSLLLHVSYIFNIQVLDFAFTPSPLSLPHCVPTQTFEEPGCMPRHGVSIARGQAIGAAPRRYIWRAGRSSARRAGTLEAGSQDESFVSK